MNEDMQDKLQKILGLIPQHCRLPIGRVPVIYLNPMPKGHQETVRAFFRAVEEEGGPSAIMLDFPSEVPQDIATSAWRAAKPSVARMLEGADCRITNGPLGLAVLVKGEIGDPEKSAVLKALELELEGFGKAARIIVADEMGDPAVGEYPNGVQPRPATSVKFQEARDHQALAQGEIDEHEGPARRLSKSDCSDLSILLYGREMDVLDFIEEAQRLRD